MTLQQNNVKQTPGTPARRLSISIALAAFVCAGVLCALGALFLKSRLDEAHTLTMNALRNRIGVEFNFDTLRTEGLRTLHITNVHVAAPIPGLGKASVDVEALRLRFSISDILRGQVVVSEVAVQGGHAVLEMTSRGERQSLSSVPREPFTFPVHLPKITLLGNDCSMEVRLAGLEQPMLVQNLQFELSSLPEAPLLSGNLEALLSYKEETTGIALSGHYKPDSFEGQAEIARISADAVRHFAALPEGLSGETALSVHAWGNPAQRAHAEIKITAAHLNYPGLPVPIEDMDASIAALLRWDGDSRRLDVVEGTVLTPLARIAMRGGMDFQPSPPVLDLSAVITDIPVESLLPQFMPEAVAKLGKVEVAFPEHAEAQLAISGALSKPEINARLLVPALNIAFNPADKQLPKASLQLAGGDFTWKNFAGVPEGTINISDGSVASAAFGVDATGLAGTVTLDKAGIALRPFVASISGKPFSGEARYELPSGNLVFAASGMLTAIEKTPLYNITHGLYIEGDVGFIASGSYARDGKITLKASADVTRGMVAFEWWLRKPIGVGANIKDLELVITPGKTMAIQGEAFVEDTHVLATFDYRYYQGKWKNHHIRVDLPVLEVNSAGKCFNIPYTATGGTCRDGFYERRAAGTHVDDNIATVGGFFEHVVFLADGGETPLVCRDAQVAVTLTSIKDVENTAELTLHTAEAHVPPFTETWLLPLGSDDPQYTDEYALHYFKEDDERRKAQGTTSVPRPWTHNLSSDVITVPPWEGRNFSARLHTNDDGTFFDFFRAEVGEGSLEGTYTHKKEDNVVELNATWDSIPAKYLIRHLELPEILAGTCSGKASHVVDQDDPRTTMRTEGDFTIVDGHFLGDALREAFQHAFSDSFAALHPAALRFDKVTSDLRIEGDHIYTDNLTLHSQGMSIKGSGVWVMEGDLDYRIDIAVSPDLADQLPVLRDSFNVQGFRMTQRDIELGFHLTGPTFSPTGQLAGLPPMAVTVVSGAAEMTSEAMRFLDTPRQMLMSIFRVGGGILGATRTQQQQQ